MHDSLAYLSNDTIDRHSNFHVMVYFATLLKYPPAHYCFGNLKMMRLKQYEAKVKTKKIPFQLTVDNRNNPSGHMRWKLLQ